MLRPEVKEDFPDCTRAGRLPRGQKVRRASPNKGGNAPTGLCGGIHLSKMLPMHFGEGSGISQVSRKRQGTKRIKYLGIYLPKETKDLYIENYKTLMKEIKDDSYQFTSVAQSCPTL